MRFRMTPTAKPTMVERVRTDFGRIDILVNNAAFQMSRESIEEISTEEFDRVFKTNVYAMFWPLPSGIARDEGGRRHYQHGIDSGL